MFYKFLEENPMVLEILGNCFKAANIKLQYRNGLPCVASSMSGEQGEGIYFRVDVSRHLDDEERMRIFNIFPIKNVLGYEVRLHGIGDFDYDDDRYWLPSVSFGFYKNNKNIIDGYYKNNKRNYSATAIQYVAHSGKAIQRHFTNNVSLSYNRLYVTGDWKDHGGKSRKLIR